MLPKKNRLASREVEQTFKKGRFWRGDGLNINYLFSKKPLSRLAIVISKKIDKRASVRNKIKRQIIASVSGSILKLVPNTDIVVRIKKNQDSKKYLEDFQKWLKVLS